MFRKKLKTACVLLLPLLLVCIELSGQERKGCCASKYSKESVKLVSLEEVSKEYKRLRRVRCEECSSWSASGLQMVMIELGNRLDGKSKDEIKSVMGKPDEIEDNDWIYNWREGHDYLYFTFDQGRGKAAWFYAYE